MAREPGVALDESTQHNICRGSFTYRLNGFVLHSREGLNLAGEEKKKTSPKWLRRLLFRPVMRPRRLVISTRKPADQNLERASCHITYTAAYDYC